MTSETAGPSVINQVQPTPLESDLLVPRYDSSTQVGVSDLDAMYPEWKEDYPDTDPELLLFDVVRTAEERRLGSERDVAPRYAAEGIEKTFEQIPKEVGRKFQAHGIAGKYGSSSTELDTLLKTGIDTDRTFYTTELRYNPEAGAAIGADSPFTEGGLVVVGDLGARQVGDSGIKYVIVGEQYLRCFDVMQSKYPDVKFVTWHDAPQFFCDLVNASEGTNYKPKIVDYSTSYEIGYNDELPGGPVRSVPAEGVVDLSVDLQAINEDEIW